MSNVLEGSKQVVNVTDNQTVGGVKTFTGNNIHQGTDTFSSAPVFSAGAGSLVLGTAQNTTSGTSFDFTGIPSWAKRITVMLNGVSTNGATFGVQLGNGSIVTTGYLGSVAELANAAAVIGITPTNLIGIAYYTAVSNFSGTCVLTNFSGNTWVGQSNGAWYPQNVTSNGGGSIALSGTLDRIRLTTVSGTDTFDAGSVNIMYEG
jgi:hypothetical protein